MVLSLPRGTARLAAVLDALPGGPARVHRDGAAVTADPLPHGVPETPDEAGPLRSRPRTEAILRAVTEGIACTDADGRITLVNPAFTQLLGHRADEVTGAGLHPLVLSRRPDGTPYPYEESPLADTLRSGRKHRVRDQVLWSRDGGRVPVDLTTAPVRDGDRLVGAVMTFTDRRPHEKLTQRYTAELTALTHRAERYAAERETQAEKYAALAARHAQLTAVLAKSLTGELDRLTESLLDHQRLEAGTAVVTRHPVALGTLVSAAVHRAAALTGPHRTRFAVHAPPIVVSVDPGRATTALAHLIADASGATPSGRSRPHDRATAQSGTTIVIVAAQHEGVLRVEVRGRRAADDPVHTLIARGIVDAHGGNLTARPLPDGVGLAHVVELPHAHAPAPAARPAATVAVPSPARRPARVSVPAPVPVPRSAAAPVAGSWIIGAAVRAHRVRTGGDLPVRTRSAPTPPPSAPRLAPPAEAEAQQRIVTLLAKLRSHSA